MLIPGSKHKTHRGERAQSLVELAVALPVMVLILLGTIDTGMAIFSYGMGEQQSTIRSVKRLQELRIRLNQYAPDPKHIQYPHSSPGGQAASWSPRNSHRCGQNELPWTTPPKCKRGWRKASPVFDLVRL